MRITDTHIAHYREHGYAIIENFLTPAELADIQDEIDRFIPGWLDYAANPHGPKPKGWDQPMNSRRKQRFPFAGDRMNGVTLHPELRRFAAINAGHDDLFCEQGDLTYKCRGHAADMEQQMHLDYSNHTLVYPPAGPKYWQTAYLIYFTDVDEDLAPTAVCSKQHYPERILWPTTYTSEQRTELYDNEVKATVPAGSVLAYSMRTFHRGTAFQKDGARIGEFVTYAPKFPWLGIVGWPEQGVHKSFRIWVERASVAERALLGFPAPGDEYWTEETLDGVAARFPEMDLSPYR